jgi:uncharacterized protein (TIGR00304 family)
LVVTRIYTIFEEGKYRIYDGNPANEGDPDTLTEYGQRFTVLGIVLAVIGGIVIMLGLILSSSLVGNGGPASFGGVVVIGPIPIVFGTDRAAVLIAVIGAIVLMFAALASLFTGARRTARGMDETSA